MAPRLTDRKKKEIIEDYLEMESYNSVAKKHGITHHTVKRVVQEMPDLNEKVQEKKQQNTADILEHMESKKQEVCSIIDIALKVLPGKIEKARTASEVTTALGTVIDKWAAICEKNEETGVQIIDDY